MIVNAASLRDLVTAYGANFKNGFTTAKSDWEKIATVVPSTTRQNHYAWLGQWPRLKRWVGDRTLNQLKAYSYYIVNEKFESTIQVTRDEIEDDQWGVYSPMFTEMGNSARSHGDELVFPALLDGFSTPCYDGQNFFDTDHPVGREGEIDSVSNFFSDGSNSPSWFLLDLSRPLKPIIFQKRREYEFRSVIALEDSRVFETDEFLFGVDARVNVGYGFWQQAVGSTQVLNQANFDAAYAAMQKFKTDEGRPMGIRATHIVCPPDLRAAALELVRERNADGSTNVDYKLVEVLDTSWLDPLNAP